MVQEVTIRSPIDPSSGAVETVDHEHHQIHEGKSFMASYITDGAPLADLASMFILIKVGELPIDVNIGAAIEGTGTLSVFEEPGVTLEGDRMQTPNMNRQSGESPHVAVFYNPTLTTAGTRLISLLMPGGEKKDNPGGVIRNGTEWRLRPSTYYLVRLTNISGGAQNASVGIQWYEGVVQ